MIGIKSLCNIKEVNIELNNSIKNSGLQSEYKLGKYVTPSSSSLGFLKRGIAASVGGIRLNLRRRESLFK